MQEEYETFMKCSKRFPKNLKSHLHQFSQRANWESHKSHFLYIDVLLTYQYFIRAIFSFKIHVDIQNFLSLSATHSFLPATVRLSPVREIQFLNSLSAFSPATFFSDFSPQNLNGDLWEQEPGSLAVGCSTTCRSGRWEESSTFIITSPRSFSIQC